MNAYFSRACAAAALLCAASVPASAQVVNGGFETGDFTGYTRSGATALSSVTSATRNSGTYSAYLGPNLRPGFLTQTLTTLPGQEYSIEFSRASLNVLGAVFGNNFRVLFGGTELLNESSIGFQTFTPFSLTGVASGTSTDLTFRYRSNLGFLLDDVRVTPTAAPIPEPGAVIGGALLFGGLGLGLVRGRKRKQA